MVAGEPLVLLGGAEQNLTCVVPNVVAVSEMELDGGELWLK